MDATATAADRRKKVKTFCAKRSKYVHSVAAESQLSFSFFEFLANVNIKTSLFFLIRIA